MALRLGPVRGNAIPVCLARHCNTRPLPVSRSAHGRRGQPRQQVTTGPEAVSNRCGRDRPSRSLVNLFAPSSPALGSPFDGESMDGVRLPCSPTGTSSTLAPPAKAAAHQHQQSINYRPPQSSDMLTQLLVTAAIVTGQDPKPLPSDARDSRLNEPAATHVARSDSPPEPTTTIGSSWRGVPTASDGAASAPTRLVAHSTSTQPHLSSKIEWGCLFLTLESNGKNR